MCALPSRFVGCIVAGHYPKLEACFSPDASVGRGRVLFRAAGSEPWYYVDMSRDGPCYSAVLPKPKPELKGFEYFQNGSSVGGNMTYAGRGHTCTVPDAQAQQIFDAALAGIPGDAGGFPVSGTTNNAGSVTLTVGGITFAGSYTRTNMDLTGNQAANPGLTQFSMTLKRVHQ